MANPTSHWLFRVKKYGYLAFLIPISLPIIGFVLGSRTHQPNLFAYFTIGFIFVAMPILDYVIGRDPINPSLQQQELLEHQRYYQILTLSCVPLLWGLVLFGAAHFVSPELNWWGKIGWALSIGVVNGGIGIVAAHELIHKNAWHERSAGGLLLANVCYATFKVEHIRGHHVWVATEKDISTAKYNQSLYHFLRQVFRYNFINGWLLEATRLRVKNKHYISLSNELIIWYLITLCWSIILTYLFGWLALVFFILQSLTAIALLEIINYIEHYGLQRKKLSSERDEPLSEMHSWNSDYLFSNLILFQLQRHSDHHLFAKRRYQTLNNQMISPQLPAGYPTMILLAMVPPLWFKIINSKIVTQNT